MNDPLAINKLPDYPPPPFHYEVATEPMTMRDIFAAHALSECIRIASSAEDVAMYAYQLADAMLEARKQPGSPE